MSAIRLRGATSGYTELVAPAIAPDGVLALPSGTGTLATAASVATAKAEAIAGGGLVAVAPTSIANSGGSASTTGNTTTFTGVTTVSLNGIFTTTFDNYKIIIYGSGSGSSSVAMHLRYRTSGTDNTTSNYLNGGVSVTHSVGPTRTYSNTTTHTIGAAADITANATIDCMRPFNSTPTSSHSQYAGVGSQSAEYGTIQNVFFALTSFDGVTLYPASGTITGIIRVYGYSN